MTKTESAQNEYMRRFVSCLRVQLARKGWTQGRLETEAGLPQGALSRLLAGRQSKVFAKTLHKLSRALNVRPEDLVGGAAQSGEVLPAGIGLTLEELPGYKNAELQVARLDPYIPIEVFEEARKTRLSNPPELITVEFLRAHVHFLAEHVFRLGNESQTRPRSPKPAEQGASGRKRRAGG